MGILLNTIYAALIGLVSPALIYQRCKYGKYREGWEQKLWGNLPVQDNDGRKRIWFHAVSVGEVLQLQHVIAKLRERLPEIDIVVTTTTQTGYQVATGKLADCQIAYFPLDFTWSVRKALQRVQPDLVILVELELWPNFLREASRLKIPLLLINGRLSEKSFRGYIKLKPLFRNLLKRFDHLAVQTEETRNRFVALGCDFERITVTGSIKFDGVQTNRNRPAVHALREFFQVEDDAPVFIAGSTQAPEEEMALSAYQVARQTVPNARLIIVPRHPERGDEVEQLITQQGLPVIRRSRAKAGNGAGVENAGWDTSQHPRCGNASEHLPPVGMLDTVGELSDCWALADVAFVGGSFGSRGGQNMLEPAAYGAATCYGPNTRNFRHIVELLAAKGAAVTVHDQQELNQFVRTHLNNSGQRESLGYQAQQVVLDQQGATTRTVEIVKRCISKNMVH